MKIQSPALCPALLLVLSLTATIPALAQRADGSPTPGEPARPTFDADVVAIAPFDVLLPGQMIWREGLVDVLSRRLDGAGPLRTISASAVISGWSGRADPASARRLGQRTRAQFAVYGELVGAGSDSVRVSASVMDVTTGRIGGTVEARNSSARMDLLADTLTIRLLGILGRARGGGVLSAVDFDTHSLPALKAYLEGEQFFRRARHDSAAVLYNRAIAIDSGFMQARRRLSWVTQWKCDGQPPDFLVLENLIKRVGGTRTLSPHDSLSLQLDSLFAVFVRRGAWVDIYTDVVAEFMAATERAVKAFPRDAEFWHLRGEALAYGGILTPATLAAFVRATQEDPSFALPWADAAEAAAQLGDYRNARAYTQAYLRAGVRGDCAAKASLFADLLPGGLTGAARERRLHNAPSAVLWRVERMFADFVDPGETEVALKRIALARRLPPSQTTDTISSLKRPLISSLLFRGRLRAADSLAVGVLASQNRMFIGMAVPSLRPASRTWEVDRAPLDDTTHPYGLWMVESLAREQDTITLDLLARRADSLFRAVPPRGGERDSLTWTPPYFAKTFFTDQRRYVLTYGGDLLRAARLLATRDTAAALRALTALPDRPCYGCFQHVVLLASLHASLGEYEKAAKYYRQDFVYVRDARHVLWAFERAVVLERLHDNAEAQTNYQYVIDAWPHPDAELATYVKQSRAALRRLH